MPPFRAGLRKRKVDSQTAKTDSNIYSDDEKSGSDDGDALLPGQLNLDGDDTDSEQEDEAIQESDDERDEILYGDGIDADSTLGEDEKVEDASDESSELADSEDDDASDNSNEDTDSDKDNIESDDVNSDAESGIGQTHSSGSDSEKKIDKQPKQKQKKVKSSNSKKETTSSSAIDRLADSIKNTSVAMQPVGQKDEYDSGDTSDEEDRRNTVGDVPMWWYNEYPHVGYDLDGRKIIKPPQRDQIDEFLKKCEDPEFWRTVRDPATGQDVVLSKDDLELLHRLRSGQVPDATHDQYKPWIEWFTNTPLAAPVRAFPDHKRSFLPSVSEQRAVARIVHALNMGWIKTRKQLADERRKKKFERVYSRGGPIVTFDVDDGMPGKSRTTLKLSRRLLLKAVQEKNFYNLWGSSTAEEEEKQRGIHKHIPAPKRPLPSHAESYNPPPEYLLDAKELKEWNKLSETPWKRKYTFLPSKFASLRHVPAYERFVRERFLRCLDLYLAPRAIKMRLTITPEDLVPRLPSPRDLQPFPTSEALRYSGHGALVRSADFDPSGQYVVSGSDDTNIKVWETSTGRCLRTITLGEPVTQVAWIPVAGLSLVAAAAGSRLVLVNPGADIGAHRVATRTDDLLRDPPPRTDVTMDERTASAVKWESVSAEDHARGVRVSVTHFRPVTHVAWHARGDYLCVTLRDAASRSVIVHQISRRRSQLPFSRAKGLVQCAVFHPHQPLLFVATQRAVRLYDLIKQELVRKLLTGAQWVSSLAVHPGGDNLLVGSYDRKVVWFDLELSGKPYQSLRVHAGAVRSVAFHTRYPLFASAGDDTNIVVSHGMVYNDLLQNPLLVPLKQLRAGARRDALCVTALRWHPAQPWLLASGADGLLRLYT